MCPTGLDEKPCGSGETVGRGRVKDIHQKSGAENRRWVERDEMIKVFGLRVHLLANHSHKVSRLQAKLIARDVEQAPMRMAALPSRRKVKTMTRDNTPKQSEPDILQVAGRHPKGVLRDFVEIVHTD